jgi:hypothetical protein
MRPVAFLAAVVCLCVAATGCVAQHRVKVDPIAVQPVHIDIDVTVHDAPASR